MITNNIFRSTSFFSILLSAFFLLSACDRGEEYGTKTGDDGEDPEAYGLQESDLPGSQDEAELESGAAEDYPADESPRGDVVAGEDNEAMEVEYGEADSTYNPQAAQYPADKIKDETNLNSNDPMELDSDFESVKKKKLMATLNRHRTEVDNRIRELQNMTGNSEDSSIVAGNVEKLKLYREKLDLEIAKVIAVEDENVLEEVTESAQATIRGAGALIQNEDMQIQQGY